ncbi:MAG: 2-hydroxyhepta-2,4-diene-1,7-dioate isomerase, partial [Ensifer adhaerens]|nr:2-hydroxyhepta-2,4-diene-1,7-dioate isomerase [Ensifer adhaerens]
MNLPRFVTFSAGERRGYGLISGNGVIDLSKRHGSTFPTLREVIEAGALVRLADEAAGL